jgi:hypothetical protein
MSPTSVSRRPSRPCHSSAPAAAVTDRYLTVQLDILETVIDRGQLRHLAEPTQLPNGKRIPGLKLDHPRQLALMHALVRFVHIAAGDTFTTRDLDGPTAAALDMPLDHYRLASLRGQRCERRAGRQPHRDWTAMRLVAGILFS